MRLELLEKLTMRTKINGVYHWASCVAVGAALGLAGCDNGGGGVGGGNVAPAPRKFEEKDNVTNTAPPTPPPPLSHPANPSAAPTATQEAQ